MKMSCSGKPPACSYAKCLSRNEPISYMKCCHYCYTFYCSTGCRASDWLHHKLTSCYYGRLSSLSKRVIAKIGRNLGFRCELSRIARGAYLSTCQRGFIWLDLLSSQQADELMNAKLGSDLLGSQLLPKYVCVATPSGQNVSILSQLFCNYFDNLNMTHGGEKPMSNEDEFQRFKAVCNEYDPLDEFILLVSIRIRLNDVAPELRPRKEEHLNESNMFVLKYMKIKLMMSDEAPGEPAVTLILTALKDESTLMDASLLDKEKLYESVHALRASRSEHRELFLANIICNFQDRGINLREAFPVIYKELCLYVDENKPFTPVCLFPRDANKNNLFMCLIMPNSEPANNAWFYDYNEKVLHNANKNTHGNDLSNYLCIV